MNHVEFQDVAIESLTFQSEPKQSAVLMAAKLVGEVGITEKPVVYKSEDGLLQVVTKPDVIRAWQNLGHTHIEVNVCQGTPESMVIRRLVPEIARVEYTTLELSLMLNELKIAYEAEHNDTKHGGSHKPHAGMAPAEPFTQFVARAMQRSRRKVELLLKVSHGLTDKSINLILDALEEERQLMAKQDSHVAPPITTHALRVANSSVDLKRAAEDLEKHGADIQYEGVKWQICGRPPEGDAEPKPEQKTFPFQNYYQARDFAIAKLDMNPPDYPDAKVLEGDFWKYIDDEFAVPSHLAAALIVDPFWDKDMWKTEDPNQSVLQRIALFAQRVLTPDGYVIVMMGQQHLPSAITELLKDGILQWHWLGVYYQKGSGTQFHGGKMQSRNKPFLIFKLKGAKMNGKQQLYEMTDTVGYNGGKETVQEQLASGTDDDGLAIFGDGKLDKTYHLYQQDLKAFQLLIERVTEEGETIIDCCAGSFTTIVAALLAKRKGIGIEKNPQHVQVAKHRIKKVVEDMKKKVDTEKQLNNLTAAEQFTEEVADVSHGPGPDKDDENLAGPVLVMPKPEEPEGGASAA